MSGRQSNGWTGSAEAMADDVGMEVSALEGVVSAASGREGSGVAPLTEAGAATRNEPPPVYPVTGQTPERGRRT